VELSSAACTDNDVHAALFLENAIMNRHDRRDAAASKILEIVGCIYRIEPAVLLSQKRDRKTCRARGVAAILLRDQGRSLTEIGAVLGRHHSTVHHMLDVAPGPEEWDVVLARRAFENRQAVASTLN